MMPGKVRPAFELSRKNFGLDYLDLYVIHFPTAFHTKPGATLDLDDPETVIFDETNLEGVWKVR